MRERDRQRESGGEAGGREKRMVELTEEQRGRWMRDRGREKEMNCLRENGEARIERR